MKMKLLIAALALASGSANAAMDNSLSGNGSLVLTVIDNLTGVSLTVDLGMNLEDFLPTGSMVNTGASASWDLTANPDYSAAWTEYLGATGDLSNDTWVVWAVDQTGTTAGSDRILSTSRDPITLVDDITNSQTIGIGSKMDTYINAVNQYDNHSTVANGASVTYTSDNSAFAGQGSAFGLSGKLGNNGSGTWVSWDNIGDSMSFYMVSNNSGSLLSKATVDTFDNAYGVSTWTFDANGQLVYAAAVPEPETYALMLAGLGLVGFAARRRARG
ncbi:MAG: PEPxxWA-CTERM sorting domain-containing protein [Pseudomonadota bacterium]